MTNPSILCIVPARMGSTRVPQKNIQCIDTDLSLVQQALDCCPNSAFTCLSTDRPDLFVGYDFDLLVKRPANISDAISNVSLAITHSLHQCESEVSHPFDIVITLMPAIAARSKSIVLQMLEFFIANDSLSSVMSVASTHPWVWKVHNDYSTAQNSWYPFVQGNSQDLPHYFIEHASVLINRRSCILEGAKWKLPLALYSLPSWSVGLDIDTPLDLHHARTFYPSVKPLLDSWKGTFFTVTAQSSITTDNLG